MDLVLQLVKNGVVIGLLYGLIAYGLSLIIATTGIFHFAHGATVTSAAYTFWWVTTTKSPPVLVAIVLAVLVALMVGAAIDILCYRGLRKRKANAMILMVASLMVLTLGQSLILLIFGSDAKAVAPPEYLQGNIGLGALTFSYWELLVVIVGFGVLLLLHLVQNHTGWGLGFRAVGDSPDRALSLGISLKRNYLLVICVGSAVAAAPAVLLAMHSPVSPTMGFDLLIKAVVVLVIGGIGNMTGALVGGVAIGLVESLAVYNFPTEWAQFVLFGALFLYVLTRPTDLLRPKFAA